MQKVQVHADIEVKSFLSQLENDELELFMREIKALLARRSTNDQKARELELLRRLNEECALPDAHWLRFEHLSNKRDAGTLNEKEKAELLDLIKEEEKLRLLRIQILGELAQLRGLSLPQITEELGINSPDHVG